MSNIAIQGAATGTGVFTLASPATNTDRTLVLPDEAGTVLTSAGVPASAMPAGSVLQVVSATINSSTSTISTSFINTPITLSITPSSSSNKIFIMVSTPIHAQSGSTYAARYTLFRGDVTGVNLSNSGLDFANIWSGSGTALNIALSMSFLDTPNTTSAQTYTVGMRSEGNSQAAEVMSSSRSATITLMEIAA